MFELKGYIERELRENEIIIWNSGMSRFVLYLYYAILFIAFVALTLSAINLIPATTLRVQYQALLPIYQTIQNILPITHSFIH